MNLNVLKYHTHRLPFPSHLGKEGKLFCHLLKQGFLNRTDSHSFSKNKNSSSQNILLWAEQSVSLNLKHILHKAPFCERSKTFSC